MPLFYHCTLFSQDVYSSNERTIRKYLNVLNPNKKQLEKLNKLRAMAEMPELTF